MSETSVIAAATAQVVGIATKWQDTYFEKVLKEIVNKETGNKSMVWYSQCKLLESDNKTRCKSAYIYEPKYGTGNFSKHLRSKHGIDVSKKRSPGEVFLLGLKYDFCYLLHYILLQKLNKKTLKDALATHIVVENLPFTYVESQTFLDIVKLLNPEAVQLVTT